MPTPIVQWLLREFVAGESSPTPHHIVSVLDNDMTSMNGVTGTKAGRCRFGQCLFLPIRFLEGAESMPIGGRERVILPLQASRNRPNSAETVIPAGLHSMPCTQSGWRLDRERTPRPPPLDAGSNSGKAELLAGVNSVHTVHRFPWRTWPRSHCDRLVFSWPEPVHGAKRA